MEGKPFFFPGVYAYGVFHWWYAQIIPVIGDHDLVLIAMATWRPQIFRNSHIEVSQNGGTPISSISMGFSLVNHPFGDTPIYGSPHILYQRVPGLCRGRSFGKNGTTRNNYNYEKSMAYGKVCKVQKQWNVEVVRCIKEWAHGSWDDNEMTWKNRCAAHWMNQWISDSTIHWISESLKQENND